MQENNRLEAMLSALRDRELEEHPEERKAPLFKPEELTPVARLMMMSSGLSAAISKFPALEAQLREAAQEGERSHRESALASIIGGPIYREMEHAASLAAKLARSPEELHTLVAEITKLFEQGKRIGQIKHRLLQLCPPTGTRKQRRAAKSSKKRRGRR